MSRSVGSLLVAAVMLAATSAQAQHRHHRRHHRRHHHSQEAPPAPAPQQPPAAQADAPPPPPPPVVAQSAPPAAQDPVAAPPPVPQSAPPAPTGAPWTQPYATRPLTLPARVLRADASIGVDRSVVAQVGGSRVTTSTVSPWLRVGAGYGITRAVEVGLSVTPLRIEGGAQFQDVSAYGRLRFWGGERVDLGAQVTLGYHWLGGFASSYAVLLRWRFERVRLDIAPGVDLFVGDATRANLRVPVDIWWQLGPAFALGLRTGVIAPDFKDTHGGILLGARAVYAIAQGDRPFVDLFASFDLEPLVHLSGTLFRDDFLVATVGAQLHFGP